MTQQGDYDVAQVRSDLTDMWNQVNRGRVTEQAADASCGDHLDHAHAAVLAARAALAADDLGGAQKQIDIGWSELASYEACVALQSTL
jgi:multidrug resistance efflux pump